MAISLNLLVLRSEDPMNLVLFYKALGFHFVQHRHGTGPMHYSAELGQIVFEIYSSTEKQPKTSGLRFGFKVGNVHSSLTSVVSTGGKIVSEAKASPWGLRAVVEDPDGHCVEIIEAEVAT